MTLDMLTVTSKKIGTIAIQATIEENANDELQITEHPVELGAPISDHAFKRMPEITIKCGWSNADYAALLGTTQANFDGGSLPDDQYVNAVYSQLLALQQSRVPFAVVSSRRLYQNMMLQSLAMRIDVKTSSALMVSATCKQVNIVQTQVTSLPPKEDQAQPQVTAETQNVGIKAAVPATLAPGGSVAPEDM